MLAISYHNLHSMEAFYLTLPSNTPFEGNTTGDYTVPLSHPIELTGRWEVGVSQLIIPVTYNTLENASFSITSFHYEIGEGSKVRTELIKVASLLNVLNEHVELFWESKLAELEPKWEIMAHDKDMNKQKVAVARKRMEGTHPVHFDLVDGRVEVQMNNSQVVKVSMNKQLQYTLGFKEPSIDYSLEPGQKHLHGHSILRAEYGADVRSGTDCFYIYCNIASPQFIGNAKAQVIKVIPATGAFGSIIDKVYHTVHYCDLLYNRFDSVKIYLRTSDGKQVSFDFGKVIVKLHFRRK